MTDGKQLLVDFADAIADLDRSAIPFKTFQPGAGPYGEPQLVAEVARRLAEKPEYRGARTKRKPDLLIPDQWAIEVKIARPFGDNGKEAENWSVNLLHPYSGNTSSIGDALKLQEHDGQERRLVVVVGYEHSPAKISLSPLLDSFEIIARDVMEIELGNRIEIVRNQLVHPIHQVLRLVGWEVH